jgi:hypothetical protein
VARKRTSPSDVRRSNKFNCSRKIHYATEPPANDRVRPYLCVNCGGWHMTSIVPDSDGWKSQEQWDYALKALAKRWQK